MLEYTTQNRRDEPNHLEMFTEVVVVVVVVEEEGGGGGPVVRLFDLDQPSSPDFDRAIPT